MAKMVHARLDDEEAMMLSELVRALESNESEVIRKALLHLSQSTLRSVRKRIIGVGKFSSRKHDLGSNKDHLTGFGK